MEGTYLLARRCPVQSRRDSDPGFGAELENLVGSVKGKRHKRQNREAEKYRWASQGRTAP